MILVTDRSSSLGSIGRRDPPRETQGDPKIEENTGDGREGHSRDGARESHAASVNPAIGAALTAVALVLLVQSLVGSQGTILATCAVLLVAATRRRGNAIRLSCCAFIMILNAFVVPEVFAEVSPSPGIWAWLPLWVVEGLLINWLLIDLHRQASTCPARGPGEEPRLGDATQELRAEQLLLESSSQSQERLRLMVECIGDYAIIMLTPEGRISSWNIGAERIFGYPSQEVVGRSYALFYTAEDVRRGLPELGLARAAKEGGWQAEEWQLRKDRSRFWCHIGISPLRNPHGVLLGFASVIRDFTEKKRAEESLRLARDELEARVLERTRELAVVNQTLQAEVQERLLAQEVLLKQSGVLRSILDSIGDAIIVAEEPGTRLSLNPAARELFEIGQDSISIDEWLLMSRFRSVESQRSSSPDEVARPLSRALAGEGLDNLELIVVRPGSDQPRWVLANARPLRHGGATGRGAVVTFRDITERRRHDQELKRAKEAAESASRAKDQLLAILSHELRNPLTPILLAAADLKERPDLPADVLETLRMVERNAHLEARLIDDLLDLTRATTGRLTLNSSRVDLHAVIEHAVETCRAGIEESGLVLSLDLSAEHHHLEGDPARLQQVYWNLIKNAIKFTPRGGRIAIRTENPPASDPTGAEIRIRSEVSDTGVGIEPDRLPRLFNAFEQRDPLQHRIYGGLGLGLAISRSVVVAHGGRLTARSEGTDRGAAFSVEFTASGCVEAHARPTEPDGQQPDPTPSPGRLRILLVDDNRDTLHYLAGILGDRGHCVTPASNYSTAARLVDANAYDLLISDIELPDGTGLEIIRDLRQRRPTPGIALSGFGSSDDIAQSHDAGFDEHLIKPIDVRTLLAAVARVTTAAERTSMPPTSDSQPRRPVHDDLLNHAGGTPVR